MNAEPDQNNVAEVVADLARRVEAAAPAQPTTVDEAGSLVVRTERNDERMSVTDLEQFLDEPRRARGSAVLTDPASFATYVLRLADQYTTIWADEEHGTFTAVFNDHAESELPGWRDHSAKLCLSIDPEWQAWQSCNGAWFNQTEFAEFLEDCGSSVIVPDAATMLEVATSFRAHRSAEFTSGVDLNTGDVQLTYNEETSTRAAKSGQIEVPRYFTLLLTPYIGATVMHMEARLRWTVDNGKLQIGYRLHRPDIVKRDTFHAIRQSIDEQISAAADGYTVPVLLGSAPFPITADS